jgi:hypothetical protein
LNSRLRSLAFVALLIVLPFSGIRVICVESPARSDDPATPDATIAAEETLTDCERLCPLHPPSSVPAVHDGQQSSSGTDTDCALSSDAAALQMLGTIAVLRPQAALHVPDLATDAPVARSSVYVEPAIALLAPPPKSSAL